MRRFLLYFRDAVRRVDKVLLLLCAVTTAFGTLLIASATNASAAGSMHYVLRQLGAAAIGIFLFIIISSVNTDFFSEHRRTLVIFNTLLLLMIIPFGTDNGTGNKSWLNFPFLPIDIQPAEICKIAFVLILASVMASHQNRPSAFKSVMHAAAHLIFLFILNMIVSQDAGVSLIFVFIFIGMAFAGGVSILWFAGGAGLLAAAFPVIWSNLSAYQQNRIEVLFNPDLDPLGIGARYHTVRSLRSLTGGGLTGQGLFNGTRTQTRGALFAQHTDYIFSAIGEELGYVGCAAVMLLLIAIIARCIWVGNRSQDYMRKLVCFGCAAAMIFQVLSNVGMCIGVTPVIGLTLPFISYGGSSIVSLYAMMGLVSGVFARPSATSHERYIRAPLKYSERNHL